MHACFRKLDKCFSSPKYLPQQRISKRGRYSQKRCGISSERLLRQRGISHLCTGVIYARLAREKMSRDKKHHISLRDLLRPNCEIPRNIRECTRILHLGECSYTFRARECECTPWGDGTSQFAKLRVLAFVFWNIHFKIPWLLWWAFLNKQNIRLAWIQHEMNTVALMLKLGYLDPRFKSVQEKPLKSLKDTQS